jgi:hypothetical protein
MTQAFALTTPPAPLWETQMTDEEKAALEVFEVAAGMPIHIAQDVRAREMLKTILAAGFRYAAPNVNTMTDTPDISPEVVELIVQCNDSIYFLIHQLTKKNAELEAKVNSILTIPEVSQVIAAGPKPAADVRRDALEEAEEARLAAAAWIETWTRHVGNCKGGLECTCGRTAILFELSALKDK